MNKKLKEGICEYNELIKKFIKSENFFEKYPDYKISNPKDFKILEKKIENIVKQIDDLDWINQFKNQFKLNTDLSISFLAQEFQQQVKLF